MIELVELILAIVGALVIITGSVAGILALRDRLTEFLDQVKRHWRVDMLEREVSELKANKEAMATINQELRVRNAELLAEMARLSSTSYRGPQPSDKN